MQPFEYNMPEIKPSEEFLSSLIPYPADLIESFRIPRSAKNFLINTGLPTHGLPTDNFPIPFMLPLWGSELVFYEVPEEVNYYSCKRNNYLVVGELSAYSLKIAINMNRGGVFTIGHGETRFFNSGIEQFVQCLGCWLFFLGIETEYVIKYDETFSNWFEVLFEDILFAPIKKKIAEIDPKAMKQTYYNWPLYCRADVGA